jgi:hypothetical protein
MQEERGERVRRSLADAENLARELRHTQQVVAGELAGWQDMHERLGRRAIRDLARGMITTETMRLEGIKRALRKARQPLGSLDITAAPPNGVTTTAASTGLASLSSGQGEGTG